MILGSGNSSPCILYDLGQAFGLLLLEVDWHCPAEEGGSARRQPQEDPRVRRRGRHEEGKLQHFQTDYEITALQNENAPIAQVDSSEDNKDKEMKEQIIRAVPNQQITQILQQYNISLAAGAKGAAGGLAEQKQESEKQGEQKKYLVQKQTTALFLQQNQFRTIQGLSVILKDVMWNSNRLLWVDLSYNYLEKIEDEIVTGFPCLKTLYLHGCYIGNLEEVRKLNTLENLHTLTLYGNPIE